MVHQRLLEQQQSQIKSGRETGKQMGGLNLPSGMLSNNDFRNNFNKTQGGFKGNQTGLGSKLLERFSNKLLERLKSYSPKKEIPLNNSAVFGMPDSTKFKPLVYQEFPYLKKPANPNKAKWSTLQLELQNSQSKNSQVTPAPEDGNAEIYQNRIKMAVNRLESTEKSRASMANKILALQKEASEENDKVQQYFSRIPSLSPRELKSINHQIEQSKHQRQRYLGRVDFRRRKEFEPYQIKYKATRHASKEAVNQRGLGRSDESLEELRKTKSILQTGPKGLTIHYDFGED